MPSSPTDPNPDIAGLRRVRDAYGGLVHYGAQAPDVDDAGGTYQCWGGVPHSLFPLISCPGPGPTGADWTATFDTSAYSGPGVIPPLDLDPQPDFALVVVTLEPVDFFPWREGCKSGGSPDSGVGSDSEAGFGCAEPPFGTGEATVTPAYTALGGAGTFNWQPWAGWDSQTYDPGRDPAYDPTSGATWSQGGIALIAPPTPVYTDVDPLDPNIDYVPYLWNWADVLNESASIDVSGDTWHRIRGSMVITVYPYYLITPATTGRWMHVL